jgi:hypothetical protein
MIKLDELENEWDQDSIIDEGKLQTSIMGVGKLHAKYLRYRNQHKKALLKSNIDYENMKKIRTEYYQGHLDQETLEEYGWEQFDLHLRKTGIEKYLESDKILEKIVLRIAYHESVIDTCKEIMEQLKSRTWQLKTLVDYQRFLSGN